MQKKKDETYVRTAIGRAYYASFLFARENYGLTTMKYPDIHQAVVETLSEISPALGRKQHELRRLRNLSDYNLQDKRTQKDVLRALELATSIISAVR